MLSAAINDALASGVAESSLADAELRRSVVCCIVPYHIILGYVIVYYTISLSYHAILYHIILCYIIVMYVCMYVCMYIYIYIHTYTHITILQHDITSCYII